MDSLDTRAIDYWHAFTLPLQNTLKNIIAFVPRMMIATLLFLFFYALATLSRKFLRKILARFVHVPWAVRVLIGRLIYLFMLLMGLLVAMSAANVNVTTVLTSLGVAGFALGFALKDILENFLAGILLLFARPFEIGDQVTLGAYQGKVEDIQIRTTTIRTFGDDTVVIPNSHVYTNAVINHTRVGRRRYIVEFDTSLSASLEQVEQGALKIAHDNPAVMDDPAPLVRLYKVDSANDIMGWRLIYWADPTKAVESKTMSETLEQIKRDLYDAGVPTPRSVQFTVMQHPSPTPASEGS